MLVKSCYLKINYQVSIIRLESESVLLLIFKEKQVEGAVSGAAVCTHVMCCDCIVVSWSARACPVYQAAQYR